jgi:hypothetical protein
MGSLAWTWLGFGERRSPSPAPSLLAFAAPQLDPIRQQAGGEECSDREDDVPDQPITPATVMSSK